MNQEAKSTLGTHDVHVLSYLSEKPKAISQRNIAVDMGISVGLVNAILKKLVNTGYVKVAHLNKKQLQYFLTPEGFSHKLFQSYRYIIKTVEHYQRLEKALQTIVINLYKEGFDAFSIEGEGVLRELIEVAFKNRLQPLPINLNREHRYDDRSAILCLDDRDVNCGNARCVRVLEELGKYGAMVRYTN